MKRWMSRAADLVTKSFYTAFERLKRDRCGNFAVVFALVAMPVIFALGASVDYVRASNVRNQMQTNLDSALVAAIKKVDKLDETTIKAQLVTWFTAQAIANAASYDFSAANITVDKTDRTIKATATATVPTMFLGIARINSVKVSASSSVSGPATSYLNVYIVLDKSASMLLAADTAGQAAMNSTAKCVFACHVNDGPAVSYQGHSYTTNYQVAKAMGVKLRADVSVTAAKAVLSLIANSDPTASRIKVGLYTVGSTAKEVLAPTFSISTARTALDDNAKGLNSATSETSSAFNTTLPALKDLVGAAGDGSSVSKPMKLVLLLTDGAISERDWVLNNVWWDSSGAMHGGSDWYKVAPLNPAWCTGIKTNKVTMGVLYTEYLAIPTDQGYINTLGDKMQTANWSTTWGGVMRSGVSNHTARRDYIPYALQDCATSKDMFLSAANPAQIEAGLSSLFQVYLGSIRLTQ
jgi:Flp pilus assembly protein TadG